MHVDLWIVELQVTVDVAQAGDAFHRLLQCARGLAERFEIVALQDVLVIAAAVKAADADRRTVLEKHLQQRNDLDRLAQLFNGFIDTVGALGQRFHAHDHTAAVGARYAALGLRSEEHTSELQSLMRISYAVFCLNKKKYHST